jgi:hypothetical protein
MHTAVIIIVCFAATFAAGLLMAGLVTLFAHDAEQLRVFHQKLAEARQKGRWEAHWAVRRESLPISQIISNWKDRPNTRRIIWTGVAFGVITFIACQFI